MPTTQTSLVRSISPEQLARAADVIKVLGHGDRLRILEVLERQGEATVTEIQHAVHLSQAIVSQHLARMRGLNVVSSRRAGQHVYYCIVEPKVQHVLNCIRMCDM